MGRSVQWRYGMAMLFALSVMPDVSAGEPLRLLTNIAPPYQHMVDGALDGTSMRALDCTLKRMNQSYQVGLSPWLRAREQVRQGGIDGFFSVAPDPDMAMGSQLSLPLALERWVWVGPAGMPPPPTHIDTRMRAAAVLGSNQLKWLQGQGLAADGSARSSAQLLRMLAGDRIQVLLMDEAELTNALAEAGMTSADLTITFQKYAPLGVYFSQHHLSANPGFLARFDEEVGHCAAANLALPPSDSAQALSQAKSILATLMADPDLISALDRSNSQSRGKTQAQLIEDDRQFTTNRHLPDAASILTLRQHPLSSRLLAAKQASDGLVAELLLFDAKGVAVAASGLPTDLWQGDEDKFQRTVPMGADGWFVDRIGFDKSTGMFQVQVSFSIPDSRSGTVAGGITIGLDIERALTRR